MSYREMIEMRKTVDHRIHNNLARRFNALGYSVEVAEHGFRLREIPIAIEEIHSVRGREIQTAKELLKGGYTSVQLLSVLAGKTLDEKSRIWASGSIRDLLEGIHPGPPPESEDHQIDYQAWFITRRPKEITSTAELREKVRDSFRENGFEMFVGPEARSELVVTIGLDKVIDHGVRGAFERDSLVRTDLLFGEIARLAPR